MTTATLTPDLLARARARSAWDDTRREWAAARETEHRADRAHANRAFHAAFREFCDATGYPHTRAARLVLCEAVLELPAGYLTTASDLPLDLLRRCTEAFREPARQRAERERLASLETCAPPAWWQGDAA